MLPPAFVKEVRDRARFSHMVVFTDHVLDQMADRKIVAREVMSVLRKGRIEKDPVWDGGHGTFEGSMRHYVAGRDLTVRVALMNGRLGVVVITAHPIGSKR